MTTELLPCPFCGSPPVRSQIGESWPTHIVRCSGCGVEMLGSDKAHLDIRWNKRVVKQSLTTDHAEIERLQKENALQHSQLLDHAQNVLPDRDATIERLRARVAELEAERDEQNAVLREATQKLVELNVKNAVLKEKLRTAEDFNENYTVIDDIGPLPKCFHCAHQQSMAFRGPDAPCYQCGIADGYPKFEEMEK